tara:strand:- start:1597 stop:2271 length:675 start_codon:yes stop_codon:yes gene_type:complete
MYLFRQLTISIFLCVILNLTYFFLVEGKFSLYKLIQKSVGYNYLSVEPYLVRLKGVDYFEHKCEGKKCLPLSTVDYTRIKFIKKIQNQLKSNEIIFLPLSLSDNIFSDLRFYSNNPIYIDTKSLGISYYAGKPYFEKYKKRFDLAYAYEYCGNSLDQKDNKRVIYVNEILSLLELNKNLVCDTSNNLDLKFKANNIKYLIDIKKPNINYSKKVCEGKYCLYKIK